jgi:hypothetical protein
VRGRGVASGGHGVPGFRGFRRSGSGFRGRSLSTAGAFRGSGSWVQGSGSPGSGVRGSGALLRSRGFGFAATVLRAVGQVVTERPRRRRRADWRHSLRPWERGESGSAKTRCRERTVSEGQLRRPLPVSGRVGVARYGEASKPWRTEAGFRASSTRPKGVAPVGSRRLRAVWRFRAPTTRPWVAEAAGWRRRFA